MGSVLNMSEQAKKMSDRPSGSELQETKESKCSFQDEEIQEKEEINQNDRIKLSPSISIPPVILNKLEMCLNESENASEDEIVCSEFAKRFHRYRYGDFNEFLKESKLSTSCKPENDNLDQRNEDLKTSLLQKEQSEDYSELLAMRERTPVMKQKDYILKAVEENQVVLIIGSTGCGKTTQVPQIILDNFIRNNRGAECSIICTQPRRISAVSVAERVAYERNESLGASVGFQIHFEKTLPRAYGSILYCTTGVCLNKMYENPLMLGINYIVLDEIHERGIETDLLMVLIKKILPYRPDIKLILMSATVSKEIFCQYFNNCCTISIEETLFPVEVLYIEDILQETGLAKIFYKNHSKSRRRRCKLTVQYAKMMVNCLPFSNENYNYDVISTLHSYPDTEGCNNLNFLMHFIFYICQNKPVGAILVFLPSFEKISKMAYLLQNPSEENYRKLSKKIKIFMLHSMIPTRYQKDVFTPVEDGIRKIILSTRLAETSVTIDDVVYVINPGRTKCKTYDVHNNITVFEEDWISKANTQQRKGRAGRVQPGICYNVFTRGRESLMLDMPIPEILCSKLDSVILSLKLLHVKDVVAFFKSFITVPYEKAINNGVDLLKRIEALDFKETLTPLGLHLARLPLDPQIGKMILMSAIFRCLDPITSAAGALVHRTPFYVPLSREDKVHFIKLKLSKNSKSDHLLTHNVIKGFRASKNKKDNNYCYKHFLCPNVLNQIECLKTQYSQLLKNACFLDSANCQDEQSNINSNNVRLLRAIIVAGLYPNISFLRKVKRIGNKCDAQHKMSTAVDTSVTFHSSSINKGQASFDSNFFAYFEKRRSKEVYLLDSTMVFPMELLIFGDDVKTGITKENIHYISVANSFFFKCNESSSSFILRIRNKIRTLLKKKALYPSTISTDSKDGKLISTIKQLLIFDEIDDNWCGIDSLNHEGD